jgi:ethanolamine ammonia-lyase small subunit
VSDPTPALPAVPDLPDLPALWDDASAENPLESRAESPPDPQRTPPDPWAELRRHTPARIALGRAGTSLPTSEVLRFAAAHAQARDAVQLPLDAAALEAALRARGLAVLQARSRAASRTEFLVRPDLGRALDDASRTALDTQRAAAPAPIELCIVVGDGLSAIAAQRHAPALVEALAAHLRAGAEPAVRLGPIVVATQARVALADEIGHRLGAALALILLGERPGLSSPDSLGAYLTWAPAPGHPEAARNCVSNIRPEGLAVPAAAARLAWLVRAALRRRVTGIELKDESEAPALGAERLQVGASTTPDDTRPPAGRMHNPG